MTVIRPAPWADDAPVVAPAPQVCREGRRVVVALHGEQDMSTAVGVAEALAGAAAEGDGDLVVDLSEVTFMDGAIVAVIVQARNDLRSRSRNLTLRAPSPFAERLLRLCGLLGFIDPVLATPEDQSPSGSGITDRGEPSPSWR